MIAYFNLQQHKGHKVNYSDSILYDPDENSTDDLYLRNVAHSMMVTSGWVEKLGLNFNDIMDMDYGRYRLLDKLLIRYREAEKRELAELKEANLQGRQK